MAQSVYHRILLKLSGEALQGRKAFGLDPETVGKIADEILEVQRMGVQIALVVGGGNIFRGTQAAENGIDRVNADYMGMLATVLNGLALQDAMEKRKVETRLMTAIAMQALAEPYIRRRAIRHLEKNRVVIFSAGTGSPYFTTDSAAALRAIEIKAELLLKATKVDGVYDADPVKVPDAKRFEELSYMDALEKGLKVMDATAISLCMENRIPIRVFNLLESGNIRRIVEGRQIGSVVR